MRKNSIILRLFLILLFFSALNVVFAKGFLGKRNMFDYDLIGGPMSHSQSFAYTRIKSNHFAMRYGYSRTNFIISGLTNTPIFEASIDNYFTFSNFGNPVSLSASANPTFKANTYSVGFLFSSSYANLDLPVGYFAAYTLYMTKGSVALHLTVPPDQWSNIATGHNKDIVGNYSFTSIGSSFDIGKTYFINPGFTFSLGIQMGAYLRLSKESFNESLSIYNAGSAPLANLFSKYPYTMPKQIPYSLNFIDDNPGVGFNLMPFLRFGYLF